MQRILVVGPVIYDYIAGGFSQAFDHLDSKNILEDQKKYRYSTVHASVGGGGHNVAFGLNKMGYEVTLLFPVGDDDFGEIITKRIPKDIILKPIVRRGESSGFSFAVNNGGRHNNYVGKNASDFRVEDVERIMNEINESYDGVVLCSTGCAEVTNAILDKVSGMDFAFCYACSSYDAEHIDSIIFPHFDGLQNRITILSSNEGEFKTINESDKQTARIREEFNWICTLGAKGLALYERGQNCKKYDSAPNPKVEEILPSGAGDSTIATTFGLLLAGVPWDEALMCAQTVGAHICAYPDTTSGWLEFASDVQKLINYSKGYCGL